MYNLFNLTPEEQQELYAAQWQRHENGADLPNDGGLINPFETEKQLMR